MQILAFVLLLCFVVVAPGQNYPAGSTTTPPSGQQTANPSQSTPPTFPPDQGVQPPDHPAPPPTKDAPPDPNAPPVPYTGTTQAPQPNSIVAAGTELRAALDQPLSTKSARAGDTFTATLAQPVTSPSGEVVVPAGAKIHGEVVQTEQGLVVGNAPSAEARLNLRFRNVDVNGTTVPLRATLVSINNTSQGGDVSSQATGAGVAKDIGIGAMGGTVGGPVFGSVLKDAVIGALAGGGYVTGTGGKDVQLPAQTGLVLRLDDAITVPSSTSGR